MIIEAIAFTALWIIDEYIATLLTFIAVPIFGGILIVSLISEKIERSKIQKEEMKKSKLNKENKENKEKNEDIYVEFTDKNIL